VHRELTYSVLRQTETGRVLIVSKDRIDALGEAVLGVTTPIAEVSGEELIGITYHPIFSNLSTAKPSSMPLRVLHASHVTAASGTGLVHCAPAHGAEDYLAFRTSNLLPPGAGTMLHHVDGAGMFDERVCEVLGDKGKELVGLEVLKAGGKKAVELLGEAGVLLKIQRIKHRYPYDWKTKQPIIVR
jgi:isoleucyl-tRNA synthetase